ncbi:hypothetical protein HPB47_019440 [Ixodes persulcatus]|uniref:Uncharacterized protein n=1 Tax=Ixodes persulcatus TaxID=34615 RepID=A0AC60QJ12_IXOPE|nr:hypothetical protein HPB47_019440 [Ixodes persulcatus]
MADGVAPKRSPWNRHCCVPGCKIGYRSAERNIPRGGTPLKPSWAVCELHFGERFVQRFYEPHVKGEIVQLKRERPALTQDAYPTVFPNLPSYLTKKPPRKRKERSESSDVHVNVGRQKRARCVASFASSPDDIEEDEGQYGCVTFAVSSLNSTGSELRSEKLLLVSTQAAGLESHKTQCLLYVKGKKLKEVDLASIEDLNQELEVADSIQTCCGAGLLQFLPLEVQPSSTVRIWDNQLITQKCAMTVHSAGVFASRGNVKGNLLAKMIVNAVILCEQAGLWIDYSCCDGASWNRSMWRCFGIKVCKEPIAAAYKADSHVLPVRVMSRVTHSTQYANAFEKMRVNLAFRLFSDEVLRGLDLHDKTVEQNCGSYSATVKFVCLINKLIQVMTSRCPNDTLRPQTPEATFIDDFLSFLADWEEKAKDGGFLSKATSEGLRVTLESTKGILAYLGHLDYEFLMTARLSHGIV